MHAESGHAPRYLFLPVLQHVLELGQLLVLIRLYAFGFVSEPAGVVLLQPLDGLLLLLLKVLHFLVILTLLGLRGAEPAETGVSPTRRVYTVSLIRNPAF